MVKKRVVILVSGRGSNMAALVEASKERDFPAGIVGVISDQADAKGLQAASALGLETKAITRLDHPDKASLDAALDVELRRLEADIVCLAGYMRLLSPAFTETWAGRMINIHPSLLPLFRGLDTHRRALDAGVMIHGCSVHFVTAEMDGGPIIAQAAVPVLPGDDEDALAARVLKVEHKLYPLALRLVADGRAKLKDGRTILAGVGAESGSLFSPASAEDDLDIESLARMTP
jgi:formyltetrahydrofolate-dependent phosphoribosylglycinamide formyltransferase